MNQNDFLRQQQAAVERMREMNARAQINKDTSHKMPPVPSFVRLTENNNPQRQHTSSNQNNANEAIKNKRNQNTPTHTAQPKSSQNKSFGNSLNIPFLDSILKDSDSTLIIGLLLILMSESSDRMLLFALIYILL